MHIPNRPASLLLLVGLAACDLPNQSPNDSMTGDPASGDEDGGADDGDGTEVIDEMGGEIAIEGVALVIPPGALAEPTTISIAPLADGSAMPDAVSPVFAFEPDGLVFQAPVTVELEFPSDGRDAVALFWSRPDGGFDVVPDATIVDGRVTGSITHFSKGYIGEYGKCVTESDDSDPDTGCFCMALPPNGETLCPGEPQQVKEGNCGCVDAEHPNGNAPLCPVPWVGNTCPAPGDRYSYPYGPDGGSCMGFDGYEPIVPKPGLTHSCTPPQLECPKYDAFQGFASEGCEGVMLSENDLGEAVTTAGVPGRLVCEGDDLTPDEEAQCWDQVNEINCRMNATNVKSTCASDSECHEGDLCDGSAQCKCCVSASSVPSAPSFPLYRYFALGSKDDGTCETPRDCIVDPAGNVSCQLSGEVWASAYLTDDADDVNQRLCIVENTDRPCLWAIQITAGEVKLQANGIPVVPDSKSYECGGTSCNGEGVFIVKPAPGHHPAMLFQDPCCKTCTPSVSQPCGHVHRRRQRL
jgi:hypothetical protein